MVGVAAEGLPPAIPFLLWAERSLVIVLIVSNPLGPIWKFSVNATTAARNAGL